MLRHCFFDAFESKKHRISELCSAISQAAIYGTIHSAIIIRELIAGEFSVVNLQLVACIKNPRLVAILLIYRARNILA